MVKATVQTTKEKIMKNIKDIIYIALFVLAISSSIVGWTRASQKESAESQALKSTVENNTAVMGDLQTELKNINTFLMEQNELNGQFKEFIDNYKRNGK